MSLPVFLYMTIIPKAKKPLDTLTALDREREVKRLRGEAEELIDAMGQDSEKKAAPIVQQYVKEQEQQEDLQRDIDIDLLKKKSNNKLLYQRSLLVILERFVKEERIPRKYTVYAESDDVGIVLGIEHTEYVRAFKVCGIPLYDIHACKILAIQLGNTVAKLEGYFAKTESGIIVAKDTDIKFATRKK